MFVGHDIQMPLGTGYIYWPAVVGIMPTSLVFGPLGAKLAHSIPVKVLKNLFSIFLAIIGIKLIIKTYPLEILTSIVRHY